MSYLVWSGIILVLMVVAMLVLRALGMEKVKENWRRDPRSNDNDAKMPSPAKMIWLGYPSMAGVFLLACIYGLHSLVTVEAGHIGVPVWFSNVQHFAYDDGLKHINPMADIIKMDGRRFAFDFSGDTSLVAVSKKQNPLTVEAAFPLYLKPTFAWKVYEKIGDDVRYRAQLVSAARAAVRSAVADYTWSEVTNNLDKIADSMKTYFQRNVERDLKKLGFTDGEASNTFEFLDVQLRKIVPDDKILGATAEKMAALQDLERQATLTQIADEIAKRRKAEGNGVSELFNALPKGFSPADISTVLRALATKVRADALLKAVETGQVDTIIMGGDSSPLPAVTSPNKKELTIAEKQKKAASAGK